MSLGVSAFIFPFLFCSFELLIVDIERLDNDVFFLLGRVFFREVFFEPAALDGEVVLLRLFLAHDQLDTVAVELAFLRRCF